MKYPKPSKLSDPYLDWEGCEETLEKIISKESSQLTVEDYSAIYFRFLPAGDYEEGCYYLEHCFNYIKSSWEIHKSLYPDGLLWWIHHFKDNLKNDGLWDMSLKLIRDTFDTLLSKFELFDLTETECNEIKRCFSYSIGPYNQGTVTDFLDNLTIYDSFQDTLNDIVTDLVNSKSLSKIRWYYEIAFHTRSWSILYEEEDRNSEFDNFDRKEALFHKLHDFKTYKEKADIASQLAANENKYKYNRLVHL